MAASILSDALGYERIPPFYERIHPLCCTIKMQFARMSIRFDDLVTYYDQTHKPNINLIINLSIFLTEKSIK